MKAKAFLLELLAGIVSALGWLFGWPVLSQLQKGLNALGLVLTVTGIVFGLVLGIAIVRSQLEPPYGSNQ